MAKLAPDCDSVDQLLDLGKILAWQSGMVQFRAAALQTARNIPHGLALRAMGQPATTSPQQLAALLDRLAFDPWVRCEVNAGSSASLPVLTVVAAVGAFRGFGGLFLRPPTIRCQDKRWFVSDGTSDWQMLADSYGTMFQRVGDATPPAKGAKRSKTRQGDNDASIDREGKFVGETRTPGFHASRIPLVLPATGSRSGSPSQLRITCTSSVAMETNREDRDPRFKPGTLAAAVAGGLARDAGAVEPLRTTSRAGLVFHGR